MARRTRPLLLLLLALVSGGVAALVALRYLRQQTAPLMATERPKARVVVAARPMPIGAVMGERDVKLVDWSGSVVPAGYFGNVADVIGRGLIIPVEENEPVLAGKLAAKGIGGGLPVIIDEGMRAFSIAVDQVIGVSGFVGPNTRVDVLLTLASSPSLKEPTTKVIMQNLRILAAGESIQQDKEGKPLQVPVVTLLVTPEQAETLGLATGQGRIQLALRNTLDTVNVKTTGAPVSSLMGTPPSRRAPVSRRTAAVQASEPEPTSTTVEVYRGGQRTLQKFGP
jgi:pilus assembly protein CpaB